MCQDAGCVIGHALIARYLTRMNVKGAGCRGSGLIIRFIYSHRRITIPGMSMRLGMMKKGLKMNNSTKAKRLGATMDDVFKVVARDRGKPPKRKFKNKGDHAKAHIKEKDTERID